MWLIKYIDKSNEIFSIYFYAWDQIYNYHQVFFHLRPISNWLTRYDVVGYVNYTLWCGWICELHAMMWLDMWITRYDMVGYVNYMLWCGWICVLHAMMWLDMWITRYNVVGYVNYTLWCGWICELHAKNITIHVVPRKQVFTLLE